MIEKIRLGRGHSQGVAGVPYCVLRNINALCAGKRASREVEKEAVGAADLEQRFGASVLDTLGEGGEP